MEIYFEGKCYVLLRTNRVHPIANIRHELIWYPESFMSLLDCVKYVPYIKSVVTENPWIISSYDRLDVFVWGEGGWKHPEEQTYGASVNKITMCVLGIRTTIPANIYDGCSEINKFIEDYESKIIPGIKM